MLDETYQQEWIVSKACQSITSFSPVGSNMTVAEFKVHKNVKAAELLIWLQVTHSFLAHYLHLLEWSADRIPQNHPWNDPSLLLKPENCSGCRNTSTKYFWDLLDFNLLAKLLWVIKFFVLIHSTVCSLPHTFTCCILFNWIMWPYFVSNILTHPVSHRDHTNSTTATDVH